MIVPAFEIVAPARSRETYIPVALASEPFEIARTEIVPLFEKAESPKNGKPSDMPRALPAAAYHGTPAVWQGDRLIAAPLAGFANGWRAERRAKRQNFHSTFNAR